jgi:hypothetical protein
MNGKPKDLVALLETFFARASVHGIRHMKEEGFRHIIDVLWFEPTNVTSECISELRLVADPRAAYGNGRFYFVDIFFPSSIYLIILELKNASLEEIWQAQQDSSNEESLEELRNKIKTEGEQQLLERKVQYREGDAERKIKTINDLKTEASQQVTKYMDVMKAGPGGHDATGIYERRVNCRLGQCTLFGYAVICVGGTRVLAWPVKRQPVPYECISLRNSII